MDPKARAEGSGSVQGLFQTQKIDPEAKIGSKNDHFLDFLEIQFSGNMGYTDPKMIEPLAKNVFFGFPDLEIGGYIGFPHD